MNLQRSLSQIGSEDKALIWIANGELMVFNLQSYTFCLSFILQYVFDYLTVWIQIHKGPQ